MSNLQYTSSIDPAQAQLIEIRDLQCQVSQKADKTDVLALSAAVAQKANQADLASAVAQINALSVEVARKADKCELDRLKDQSAQIVSSLQGFASKVEVNVLQSTIQGLSQNFSLTAKAVADAGCEVFHDLRLDHLARTLAAVHCGLRDDRVRVDTLIAASTDAATKTAMQAFADAMYTRWDQVLTQFVGIAPICGA